MMDAQSEALVEEIRELKRENNAVVLAHYYQPKENHLVADYLGDSLELSRRAVSAEAESIVFAGVHFMAEIAKVLNPERTVLLPRLDATCGMVDMIAPEHVIALRKQFPGIPVVAYVNTTAAVKAEADICCTSRNAVEVVRSLDTDQIIFVPDMNVARYVRSQTGITVEFPIGFCTVHKNITVEVVEARKRLHPEALVLAHPECEPDVLAIADVVASTGGMLDFVKNSPAQEFIIATEENFIHALRQASPERKFYSTNQACCGMMSTRLIDIRDALANKQHEITIPPSIAVGAAKASTDACLGT
jgi:quinolinate synthase